MKTRIGILISGRGSNMGALIAACNDPDYPAKVVLVISNRPDAAGLATARDAGIETQVVDHTAFASRGEFEKVLDSRLRAASVELVCNAGFMRLLTPFFVNRWRGRQLNIHPSLLPEFRGLDTHERVLKSGKTESGCTVHYVCTKMDAGPIIAQRRVRVRPDDDAQTLAARILEEEHRLYPQALKKAIEELTPTSATPWLFKMARRLSPRTSRPVAQEADAIASETARVA